MSGKKCLKSWVKIYGLFQTSGLSNSCKSILKELEIADISNDQIRFSNRPKHFHERILIVLNLLCLNQHSSFGSVAGDATLELLPLPRT